MNIEGTNKEFIRKIYAAPVANSADGNGAPFKNTESAWPALGYFVPEFKDGEITNQIGKEAELGFAIASPQLFLAEGLRTISIGGINLKVIQEFIEIFITGEKEWIKVDLFEEDNPFSDRVFRKE